MNIRIKWITRHPIQAKYLLIVLMAMLAPTLLFGYCFYHLVFSLLAKEMVFPEAIMANIVPVVERVNQLLSILLPPLVLITLWIALAISHRFAGPIERLETDLDEILTGNHNHKIRLRKNDDLSGVAQRINALVGLLARKT